MKDWPVRQREKREGQLEIEVKIVSRRNYQLSQRLQEKTDEVCVAPEKWWESNTRSLTSLFLHATSEWGFMEIECRAVKSLSLGSQPQGHNRPQERPMLALTPGMSLNPTRKSGSSEAGNFSQVHSVCLEFGCSNQLITQVNHVTVPCSRSAITPC